MLRLWAREWDTFLPFVPSIHSSSHENNVNLFFPKFVQYDCIYYFVEYNEWEKIAFSVLSDDKV